MSDHPFVTVIMPTRNEEAFIERSLGAVLTQNYPADRMEVIVADGMSDDATRDIVRSLQRQYSNLRLIDNPSGFVPPAMNDAIRQARGEIVVRVDGHAVIESDYVSTAVATLQRTGADMVGGPMRPYGDEPIAQSIALATTTRFGIGGGRFHYAEEESDVDTVYIGTCRRDLYLRMGGFDEEMIRAQDAELSARIVEQGGRIVCNPAIRSRYFPRSSFRALRRQYFWTGYWKVRVLQKHPRRFLRQLVPSIFVATVLISLLTAPFSAVSRRVLFTVLGAYIAANLTASVATARNGNEHLLRLLPLTFATLHVAHGSGFLYGLLKFCNRWGEQEELQPLQPVSETA